MIEAGSRGMTVSMSGAQFLRSAHRSRPSCGAFTASAIYRVSGVFLRPPATGTWRHGATFQNPACRNRPCPDVLERQPIPQAKRGEPMLYAILAYHVEAEVMSWTPEEDAALMVNLLTVHDRLNAQKLLGPS